MLAQRTQKLIEELKPDQVLVQTSPQWWDHARRLQYVDSQAEFNKYAKDLDQHCNYRNFSFYQSNRKWLFLARLYVYHFTFNLHFRFGRDFNFLRPGLEAKLACEAAERVGAQLSFLGSELDQKTWQRLNHETRFNVPHYVIKRFQYAMSRWVLEAQEERHKLA